ncbi:MAG: hypothetical protein IJZ93_04995 [Clostridia bacterium]|nr:hypothetical protein [Clostridia bacterium]
MLTVKPIQSKNEQEELCSLCSATYNVNSFAYRADDGKFIGVCQFRFDNGIGIIEALKYAPDVEDWEAMIIMLRTAMNFMFRCGIDSSYFEPDSSYEELVKRSGYRPNKDGIFEMDIKKFYTSSCH